MANTIKLRITSWIGAGFLLTLGCVFGLGWYVVTGMHRLQSISHDLYAYPFVAGTAATQLQAEAVRQRNLLLRITLTKNSIEIEQLAAQALVLENQAKRQVEVVKQNSIGDSGQVAEAQRLLGELANLRGQATRLALQGRLAEAGSLAAGPGSEAYTRLDRIMDDFVGNARQRGEAYALEAEQVFQERVERIWILLAVVAVLIVLTGIVVVRGVIFATRQRRKA